MCWGLRSPRAWDHSGNRKGRGLPFEGSPGSCSLTAPLPGPSVPVLQAGDTPLPTQQLDSLESPLPAHLPRSCLELGPTSFLPDWLLTATQAQLGKKRLLDVSVGRLPPRSQTLRPPSHTCARLGPGPFSAELVLVC